MSPRSVAFAKHEKQNSKAYENESSLYRQPILRYPRSAQIVPTGQNWKWYLSLWTQTQKN